MHCIILLGYDDFLEGELLRVIEESRTSWKLLGTLNTTFIALIPKKNDIETYDDCRPISLCNCVYKIISVGQQSKMCIFMIYNSRINWVLA